MSAETANPIVRSILSGNAPRPAKLAAARGVLPLSQTDLLEVLASLINDQDEEIASAAGETLREQAKTETIVDILKTDEVPVGVLSYFVQADDIPREVQEIAIINAKTPDSAILNFVRKTQDGSLLELVAINQQRLIRTPELIEAIIENPHRTAEAERRARETKREFFEKERGAQQIANELRTQGNLAAAEFIEKAEFVRDPEASGLTVEDAFLIAKHIEIPDSETDDSWLALEYIEELYEETEQQRALAVNKILNEFRAEGDEVSAERVALINRIMRMSVKDRVKLAMKGDREARSILIRDSNRVVAQAVIQNPRITDQEVEKIAAMRTVPEEVLRQIASNRQWAKLYPVIHNLARNPRTPVAVAMGILTRLHIKDLEALSKNRNVSDAVRTQALRLSKTRKGN
ncbi:MAG: hypothetical protein D6687_12145 [Acidobacteria bacterium]|jgi:hypothetical protein|nr:MAG: hypothetical protein D6687_12145 [Acidobacteriota bacterium]GIU82464.1 MAG: hypothetical protein KatS3mg006_1528 [Pyrinomonadaceae bacterium]